MQFFARLVKAGTRLQVQTSAWRMWGKGSSKRRSAGPAGSMAGPIRSACPARTVAQRPEELPTYCGGIFEVYDTIAIPGFWAHNGRQN